MKDLKSHTVYISNLDQIASAATQILDIIGECRIVLLHGNLGAGKTTLTQQMASQLGYTGATSSPTYSLINEYDSKNGEIFHMDLYRLNDIDEAYDIGIEDYLFSGQYCFIEWPELIMDMIEGEAYVQLHIEQMEGGARKIDVSKFNP